MKKRFLILVIKILIGAVGVRLLSRFFESFPKGLMLARYWPDVTWINLVLFEIYNVFFIGGIIFFAYLLFEQLRYALLSVGMFFCGVAILNSLKHRYSGVPLLRGDLMLIREFFTYGSQYSPIAFGMTLCFVFGLPLVIVLLSLHARGWNLKFRFMRTVLATICFTLLYRATFLSQPILKRFHHHNRSISFALPGLAAAVWGQPLFFALQLHHAGGLTQLISESDRKRIRKSNYRCSVKAAAISSKLPPDIVVYVVESLIVPESLSPELRLPQSLAALAKKSVSYRITPSTFGGRSLNTEFEILTGYSLSLIDGIAFFRVNLYEIWSISKYLTKLGYSSTVLHNSTLDFFNYRSAYRQLGFTNLVSLVDAGFQESHIYGRDSVSDTVIVDTIIDELRDSRGPRFIYAFTDTTHGPYLSTSYIRNLETEISRLSFPKGVQRELAVYFSRLEAVGIQILRLKTFIDERVRPTLLIVLGDHAPRFAQVFTSLQIDPYTVTTPLFVSANFELEQLRESFGIDLPISANFFPIILRHSAKLPSVPWIDLLSDLYKITPVLSSRFTMLDGRMRLTQDILVSLLSQQAFADYYLRHYSLLEDNVGLPAEEMELCR